MVNIIAIVGGVLFFYKDFCFVWNDRFHGVAIDRQNKIFLRVRLVGEIVADALAEIQERYNTFISDKELLNKILIEGAQKASYTAEKTLRKVYRKVGFYSVK